jgi:hypothetical protein
MLLAAGPTVRIPKEDLAFLATAAVIAGLIPLAVGIGAALKLRSNPEVPARPWVVGITGVFGGLLTGAVTFLGRGICGWPLGFIIVIVIIAITATAPQPNCFAPAGDEDEDDDDRPRRGRRKLRYDEIRDAEEERRARSRRLRSDHDD